MGLMIWMFMVVAGLWALLTGKLPMIIFSGSGTYKVDGAAARIIGACLAFGALLSYSSIVALNIFSASADMVSSLICCAIPIVLSLGGTAIAVTRLRTPYQGSTDPDVLTSPVPTVSYAMVSQKVRAAAYLIAIGMGIAIFAFPFGAAVVFAYALIQAGRAVSPMKEAQLEERFKNDVNFLRLLSAVLAVSSLALTFAV